VRWRLEERAGLAAVDFSLSRATAKERFAAVCAGGLAPKAGASVHVALCVQAPPWPVSDGVAAAAIELQGCALRVPCFYTGSALP